MDNHIISPDINSRMHRQLLIHIPNQGWNLLEKRNIALPFAHGGAFFVDRNPSDNLPASDITSISDQTYALSERGEYLKVTGYTLLINIHEKILPSFSPCRI